MCRREYGVVIPCEEYNRLSEEHWLAYISGDYVKMRIIANKLKHHLKTKLKVVN